MRREILRWLTEATGIEWLDELAISSLHFVVLAFVVCVAIAAFRIRREQLSLKVGAWATLSAGFGALWLGNWVALAFNPDRVVKNPMTLLILVDGGFSSIGAYAGAALLMMATLRFLEQPFWPFADAMAPGLMIGAPIARMGCLWAGCDFGKVAPSLAWAIRYPRGTPAFRHLDEIGMVGAYQRVGLPMHPYPLYEAVPILLVGVALLIRPSLLGSRPGQRASGCAVLYCVFRLVAETFRADTVVFFGQMTALHLLCAAGIALFGSMWWRLRAAPNAKEQNA